MTAAGADDGGARENLNRAAELLRSGDPPGAQRLLEGVAADVLADPADRYRLAQIWLQLGNFERALSGLRSAAEAVPNNAAVWNDLGGALSQLGYQSGALAAWKHAAGVRPVFPPALYNHALALEACGRLDEARSELQTVLDTDPDIVPVLALLGRISAQDFDADSALRCYRRVLEIEPNHFDAAFGAACIELDSCRFAEAAEDFARCIELEPDNLQVRLNLALCLQELGRQEEALDHYREILRREPKRYYAVVKSLLSAARGVFWLDSKELRRRLMPR